MHRRALRGDFQTPDVLAREALACLAALPELPRPVGVLEPTCGLGAFLRALDATFPGVPLHGWELDPTYLRAAALTLPPEVHLRQVDVFRVDWKAELSAFGAPLWLVGNPPWVTIGKLGALQGNNHPDKSNVDRLPGLAARTGAANFDVSEWLLRQWLEALAGRPFVIAMICKASVARKVFQFCVREAPRVTGRVFEVDARSHFKASVSAVFLVLSTTGEAERRPARPWPWFAGLGQNTPARMLGQVGDELVADLDAFEATRGALSPQPWPWRSGVKHDCAAVMELAQRGGASFNGAGDVVMVEAEHLYPFVKSTDLHHGRLAPVRRLVLPQRRPGQDTKALATSAPGLWAYLQAHADLLAARRSSIYRGQPPFSVFGVGPYSFAPWKVAVSGLHASLRFQVVGPHEGRPVLFDDTCYFLPFADEATARTAHERLSSADAQRFFRARLFPDAKRPVTQKLLGAFDLGALPLYSPSWP